MNKSEKEYSMRIVKDPNPTDLWGDSIFSFISTHARYSSVNADLEAKGFSSLKDLENYLSGKGYIFQKVYCHDHSSISLKAAEKNPFSSPFDSFPFGYVIISKSKARKEYNIERISKGEEKNIKNDMISFVNDLNSFYNGEVFGFEISEESGEVVESCYGFYNYKDCEKEGYSVLINLSSKLEHRC
tara:strand:+ start:12596 stop:13153 length:558 start_codon:yes stop_codon:yes gene_type:complete